MKFSTQMCKIVTKFPKIACAKILPQRLILLPHRFMQILFSTKIRFDFAQFFKLFCKILVWFLRKNFCKIYHGFFARFLTDSQALSETKNIHLVAIFAKPSTLCSAFLLDSKTYASGFCARYELARELSHTLSVAC